MRCFIITLIFLSGCQDVGYTQIIASRGIWGQINTNRLADAIYKTEHSKRWPYGIKHHYKHTSPRQACLNTINHRLRNWNSHGDFIVYLGLVYSPPSINPNWVRLVRYFYERNI